MEPLDWEQLRPTDKVPGHHWDPYKKTFVKNLSEEELASMWPNASKQQRRQEEAILNDRGELTSPPGSGVYTYRISPELAAKIMEIEGKGGYPNTSAGVSTAALVEAEVKEAEAPKKDNVNLPVHYARYKIEPIRFICENRLDWFQGNTVKYTCRHDAKNGIEDIDKAIRYLQMYKQFLLGNPDWWRFGKPEDLVDGPA